MIDEKRLDEIADRAAWLRQKAVGGLCTEDPAKYVTAMKSSEAMPIVGDLVDLLAEVRRLNDALNQILSATNEPWTKAMTQRALGIYVEETK